MFCSLKNHKKSQTKPLKLNKILNSSSYIWWFSVQTSGRIRIRKAEKTSLEHSQLYVLFCFVFLEKKCSFPVPPSPASRLKVNIIYHVIIILFLILVIKQPLLRGFPIMPSCTPSTNQLILFSVSSFLTKPISFSFSDSTTFYFSELHVFLFRIEIYPFLGIIFFPSHIHYFLFWHCNISLSDITFFSYLTSYFIPVWHFIFHFWHQFFPFLPQNVFTFRTSQFFLTDSTIFSFQK